MMMIGPNEWTNGPNEWTGEWTDGPNGPTGDGTALLRGKEASRQEKARALDVTLAIRSEEHGGKSQIVALDEDAPRAAATAFYAALGCDDATEAKIKSAEEGGDDDKVADTGAGAVRLYHASDESGELTTAEVTDRPLSRDALKTEDVFVLVAGGVVYAWVGKKAGSVVYRHLPQLYILRAGPHSSVLRRSPPMKRKHVCVSSLKP